MVLPSSTCNSVHWENPQFVDIFGKYMSTTDEAARLQLATQLSQIQQDDTPMIVAFVAQS